MKKMSKTIKRSLIGLALVQSIAAQAYFAKGEYLDQTNFQNRESIRKGLFEKLTKKSSISSIEKILGYVTATINKDAKTYGPIYRHNTRNEDKYGDNIVKIILKAAHKRAKNYLNEGNPEAYYAFLALALTVPNQEGLFVHFREVPAKKDNCNDKRSTGEGIKSHTAKNNFKMALNATQKNKNKILGIIGKGKKETSDSFLVKCKQLRGENTYKQLIVGGSDGSDVGMFQLSSLWHYDKYLEKGQYDSVKQTIEYGIKYLFMGAGGGGFRRIVNDQGKKYTCMLNAQGDLDYKSVIRGTWSSYNGGPKQYCRFANKTGPYASHDSGFKKNLQITLNLNDGGFFGFQEDSTLQLSPNVRAAVEELVTNFEEKTNNNKALNSLLN